MNRSPRSKTGLIALAAIVGAGASGCWDSHARDDPESRRPDPPCSDRPAPTCATQTEGACGPWTLVAPVCEPGDVWGCPAGAHRLDDPTPEPPLCLPFYVADGPVWSVELLTGVPSDGACAWIAQFAEVAIDDGPSGGGTVVEHAALRPDAPARFGACPTGAWLGGGELPASVDGELADGDFASILDAARMDGETLVSYRVYEWAADAPWPGLRSLHTGLARWDEAASRLRYAGPIFDDEEDVGDALVVADGTLYALGCSPPSELLHEDCVLAAHTGDDPFMRPEWGFLQPSGDIADAPETAATIFPSGPERSSLRWVPGLDRYVHLYVAGFGDTVMMRTADAPEGPWSPASALIACDLPSADPEAYCGSPTLRLELVDPRRPEHLAVSYDVSTLAEDRVERTTRDPSAYWPRLAWVTP